MEATLLFFHYLILYVAIVMGFSIGFWNLSNHIVVKKSSKIFMKLIGICIGLSVASSLSVLDYTNDIVRYILYTIIAGSWLFGLGSLVVKKAFYGNYEIQ